MTPTLSERPNLTWYKKAAKKKLAALRALDSSATLATAQLATARERGFSSWRALAAAIGQKPPALPADVLKAFGEAIYRDRGDVEAVRALLDQHPALANAKPWAPKWDGTAIDAVVGMCVWHRPKMRQIARLLVERGAAARPDQLARAGLLEELQQRVAADPAAATQADDKGRTPMYRAACVYGGFPEGEAVADWLMSQGIAADLYTASTLGLTDRVREILLADPGAARRFDPDGMTALHWACRPRRNNTLQIVRLLLDAGADVEAVNQQEDGMHPLHHCGEWESPPAIAELLLERGADINARAEKNQWTPLDYAIDRRRPIVELFRSRGGKTRQELAESADDLPKRFLKLVSVGDLAGVRAMLDATPSLANAVGPHPSWGGTPQALHVAIERNHFEIFRLLLDRGAHPGGDNAGYDHWTPAMLAVHWKRPDMLEELNRRTDAKGLFVALMTGDDELALRLLQDPRVLDRAMPNNGTPLHFATTVRAAERLLELGVDLNKPDKYGRTAIQTSADAKRPELVTFLIERGATATPETFAKIGDIPRLQMALGRGKPPASVAFAAVDAQQIEVVRWLLDRGADVNSRSANGSQGTLLHSAAWNGNLEMARLLVAAGADIHAVDREHETTPLAWARTARQYTGNVNCDAVAAYLETLMSPTATDPNVDAFLNLAVPKPTENHQSGTQKPAAAILKMHPKLADDNIYAAAALGKASVIAKLLKRDKKLATAPGGPRNWQPLSYLAFSRFLKWEPKRTADFVKSAKLLLNAGADANTYWLEKPDDPNSIKESVLYGAAGIASNTRLTKLFLDAGANPDDHGDKPADVEALYHACEHKNNEILKLLRDHGASDKWWSYCLLRKLDFDDFAGAKYMLDRGANSNHLHPGTGRAALHWAIMRRRGLKFIKAIHAAGGELNLKDKEGLTPYTLATRLGRSDVAEYLLKHGATDDRDERARFIDAAVAGDTRTVRTMLKRSPKIVASLTPAQLQALPGAAAAGNVAGVKAMLDLGFPIDTQGDWAGTALHHAAWNDHPAIVKLLIKRGARIDVYQQWNGDALHTALHAAKTEPRKHSAEIVGAMIKLGRIKDVSRYLPFDPDEPGADKVLKLLQPYLPKHSDDPAVKALPAHRKGHKIAQWKPIMDAAYAGDADRIRKLLKEGADPNIVSTTPARYRPLHRAIERKKSFKRGPKDIEAVKALLAGGADPKLRGGWGKETALQMAATYEPLFVPVLIDYFQPLDIFHACAVGDERRVAELLKKDRSLAKARDQDQWTPLHFAAASRMHEVGRSAALLNIARLLLKAGADIMAAWNFNDEWPLRPLYYAAGWSNHPAMVELLLQNGADACDSESTYHAADEGYDGCLAMIEKYTPAKELAKECTMCLSTQLHWGHIRGAKWLLEHGADANTINPRFGKSALQIAAENGASEGVIALLLKHGGDPKVKNEKGQTAIDLAKAAGKTRVVEQLENA